jgi:hypothetical protein
LDTIGIGRIKMMISVRICMEAFVNQTGAFGRQWEATRFLFMLQKMGTGTQKMKPLRTIQSPATTRKPMRRYAVMRKGRMRNMDVRKTRAESLERMRERL